MNLTRIEQWCFLMLNARYGDDSVLKRFEEINEHWIDKTIDGWRFAGVREEDLLLAAEEQGEIREYRRLHQKYGKKKYHIPWASTCGAACLFIPGSQFAECPRPPKHDGQCGVLSDEEKDKIRATGKIEAI